VPLISTKELSPTSGDILAYSGMDSAVLFEIEEATRSLEDDPNTRLISAFEHGMQAPALEMSLRGFRVDPIYRDKVIADLGEKIPLTLSILNIMSNAIWSRDLNPNSSTQLKSFFYETMKLPPVVKWEHGERTTPMNRETLESLGNYYYAAPLTNTILLARDLQKSRQVLQTEIDSDMRWRCSYNIGGTKTGRWSSSKSPFGTGNNFQNITEELRRCFIPDPGLKLFGIDLKQSESHEVGWFCGVVFGDWQYFNMVRAGDLHTQIAQLCWPELPWTGNLRHDRPIADRRFYRHFTYRDTSKRLGHGTNYCGRPATMSAHTKIPRHIVERFYENYLTSIPAIGRMHQWVADTIQTQKYLVNFFGRRRNIFDRLDADETIRGAVAYLFQSATGDRLNLGLWRLWKYLGTEIQLLSQLHDAVYFQADPAREAELIPAALRLVEVALSPAQTRRLMHLAPSNSTADDSRRFIVPGEASGGWNWAHRFKLDEEGNKIDWNPRGLQEVKQAA
jgi:DNA polymerase I-like protein with 3'-5' exonuclease and polymerase domains